MDFKRYGERMIFIRKFGDVYKYIVTSMNGKIELDPFDTMEEAQAALNEIREMYFLLKEME